jgi:catechol 2,3-dioxygenase-like lactoylglutathione lyase family enzyme
MRKKFDPKTFQLGYVALGTPDIERTKDHYLKILGMSEVSRGDDGSVYLSIGYNHHDLVLRPAKEKALLHVGFQLKPHISVNDLAGDAREHGLAATVKRDSQPGIAELVEVETLPDLSAWTCTRWTVLKTAMNDKAALKKMLALKESLSKPGRQWQH